MNSPHSSCVRTLPGNKHQDVEDEGQEHKSPVLVLAKGRMDSHSICIRMYIHTYVLMVTRSTYEAAIL